eukprot:CAMPEP_0178782362 /NCGR_PEP_ID=MMETSP0745-20121128/3110_1 /TAXON_ID=913974 /ORGANISM="Nitzschia punctata, Strain CCMP561" /LENGTH=94 /DNA_ID=CAMNT_0020439799 /DNA_START=166 /DNA_END=450 /DNA_ORIENTATION=-
MISVVPISAELRMNAAALSAIMTVGVAVCPPGIIGIAEESATRTPLTPITQRSGETTASFSVPILQVPTKAFAVCSVPLIYSSISSSVCTSIPG